MFYNADPAEFIKMRIEAISLMACTDEQLAPAFDTDRTVSTSRVGDKGAPEVSARFGA